MIIERGAIDRFGQLKKLCIQALYIQRIGNYPLDGPFEHLFEVRFPAGDPRLRTGNGDGLLIGCHRKDFMALGKCQRHQSGNRCNVNFKRINAHIRLLALICQPGGEGLKIEGLAVATGVDELLLGQKHQGMHRYVMRLATCAQCLFGTILLQAPLGEECGYQLFEIQPVVTRRGEVHKTSLDF